jgi:UDP-N-acetylglucosamine 2-epimerase (non-hydrolysing)
MKNASIPPPIENLGSSNLHFGEFLSKTVQALTNLFIRENPDAVVVYGDVNSTLAAGLAASKARIHLIHVESGLRSFESNLPEETNRIIVDSISDTLITSMPSATENLLREGISKQKIFFCGNTMIDSLEVALASELLSEVVPGMTLTPQSYVLVTLHRGSNVDDKKNIAKIVDQLEILARNGKVIFPIHPRTLANLPETENLHICDPLSYVDFIKLTRSANFVITDSGGIQEETTHLGIPCFTLRPATERPETVSMGTNTLIGIEDISVLNSRQPKKAAQSIPLWDGMAGSRIADLITELLSE